MLTCRVPGKRRLNRTWNTGFHSTRLSKKYEKSLTVHIEWVFITGTNFPHQVKPQTHCFTANHAAAKFPWMKVDKEASFSRFSRIWSIVCAYMQAMVQFDVELQQINGIHSASKCVLHMVNRSSIIFCYLNTLHLAVRWLKLSRSYFVISLAFSRFFQLLFFVTVTVVVVHIAEHRVLFPTSSSVIPLLFE